MLRLFQCAFGYMVFKVNSITTGFAILAGGLALKHYSKTFTYYGNQLHKDKQNKYV